LLIHTFHAYNEGPNHDLSEHKYASTNVSNSQHVISKAGFLKMYLTAQSSNRIGTVKIRHLKINNNFGTEEKMCALSLLMKNTQTTLLGKEWKLWL
jgi:hypothetical protein